MNEQNQSLLDEQLVYRLDRLDLIDGWWLWALLIGLLVALFWFVIRWYRRDVRELPQGLSTSIMMLRIFALVLLVFFFLQPERRNRQRVGRPSEAAVMVDTSQSMSLAVGDQNDAATRIDVAKQLLSQSPLLTQLAKDHRVVVYGVGTSDEPEELWTDGPRQAQEKDQAEAAAAPAKLGEATTTLKVMAWLGTIILIASCIALLLGGIESWRRGVLAAQHWVLSGSVLGLVGGLVVSIAATLGAGSPLASLWGFGSTAREVQPATQDNEVNPPPSLDFADALAAAGAHSPLGDGLQWLQRRHDPATLAGVVLITDGQSNGGISLEAAGRQLGRQGVPVYPVGLGSSQPPANVRVVDLEVPPRVYPGDRFSIAATLQGTGLSSPDVEVQLLDGLDADPWQPLAVETRRVTLPTDGSPVELQFELEPETVGRRQIGLEVKPAQGEQNVEDNKLTTRYEVVTRKLRVMVLAGGPMREYQFVRNLLYRDREITVDVWLQSGQEGMSQEANQLLTEFPSTPEALFEYDVIVAFDPDWDQFNAAQIELLDRWVAEQAGGLIYVAGPVFTPRLVASRNEQKATVRSLLP